jgi:AAA domain (Cdc48 subfamily)
MSSTKKSQINAENWLASLFLLLGIPIGLGVLYSVGSWLFPSTLGFAAWLWSIFLGWAWYTKIVGGCVILSLGIQLIMSFKSEAKESFVSHLTFFLIGLPFFLFCSCILFSEIAAVNWATTLFATAVPLGLGLAGICAVSLAWIVAKDPSWDRDDPTGVVISFSSFTMMYLGTLFGLWSLVKIVGWFSPDAQTFVAVGCGAIVVVFLYAFATQQKQESVLASNTGRSIDPPLNTPPEDKTETSKGATQPQTESEQLIDPARSSTPLPKTNPEPRPEPEEVDTRVYSQLRHKDPPPAGSKLPKTNPEPQEEALQQAVVKPNPQPQPSTEEKPKEVKEISIPTQEELVGKLRARVIGQEKAIDTLALFTRGWLSRKEGGKPLVVLLPGPTGTGKTELCKALGAALGTSLIRFDMGEFDDKDKANKLFGSAPGYMGSEQGGRLPNAIRESDGVLVVLFDEVEKAYSDLWQQMLAFFDEGRVSDSLGTEIAPKNTICLMSTNLKSDEIGDHPEQAEDILRESKHFSREFLGRVNKILPMPRLSPEDQIELSKLLVRRLGKEYEIELSIDTEALEKLQELTAKAAYYGGGRGIAKELESMFLKDLLELRIAQWDKAQIKLEDGQLKMVGLG